MGPNVNTNNRGFTLIELLVSVVILSVGLLALLQTVNVALMHNSTNMFRDEAIQIADEQMALEMTKPFALISTGTTYKRTFPKQINLTLKNYSVVRQGTSVSANTTRVQIDVKWKSKQQSYTHTISSMLSKFSY